MNPFDDTVHATVTVLSVENAKARAVLSTVCRVKGTVVIEGKATVMTTSMVRRCPAANASRKPAAAATLA